MKKLIINADDFGFSEAFNYGVIHAFEHGVLTSASLMPNMEAAVHATALARMHPRLCISQHTNLVQGSCCADPATIPSIARPDGSFYRSWEYKGVVKPGRVTGDRVADREDVKREACAQLERFKQLLGYYPVHMEGHSMMSEGVILGLMDAAQEYGIHCMSFDGRPQKGYADVCFPPFPGADADSPMADYNVNGLSVESLIATLELLKGMDCEIGALHCHPGYVDATIMDSSTLVLPRCRDVQTLCDPRVAEWIEKNGIELIRYDGVKLS